MQYLKRDRALLVNVRRKERDICYDFKDPVLNREFHETSTKHNQVSYRMRSDPFYAQKVIN